MSHIIQDSFDPYSSVAEAVGLWDGAFSGGAISSNTRFGAGQSYRPSNTLNVVSMIKTFGQNAATGFLTFSLGYYDAIGAATNNHTFRFYDGTTVQCSIRFVEDGSIAFYRGDAATLLGTYTGAWSGTPTTGFWQHLQIKIVFSNTVGEFHVRKNGATADDYALTGVDNCSTANEYSTKVDLVCNSSSSNLIYLDDLWIYSGTAVAGEPSDWIGDVRAVQVVPNSDSSVTFSRSSGATNYTLVDELINASADYVYSSTVGNVDLYGNAGLSVTPASILCVTARAMMLKTDAGARTASLRVRSSATNSDRAAVAVATSLQSVTHPVFLDPNTSAAWAAAAVAAATFGPVVVS